jgi:hypothetical protein
VAKKDDDAKRTRKFVDQGWPSLPDGEHAVTELASPVAGGLSPFGDVEFPLTEVPYDHPTTEINR